MKFPYGISDFYSNLRLRTYAVVALSFERLLWEEV